jgi:hypothetical protein
MNARRALVALAAYVLACCALAACSLPRTSGVGPLNNPTDLVAFYCAGRVAAHGDDPYRAEPLRSCERDAFAESRVPLVPHLVVPAPLPGYDLAVLAPLSLVPFRIACIVWACALVAAGIATALVLASVTGLRPVAAFASLALADVYASLVPGQLVPFVVLALAACGWYVVRDRPRAAAVCALAMLVEPHLGLPVVISLAVWLPRARATLAVGVVALAVSSVAFLGLATNVEYVAHVLPVQAATEGLEFSRQYGLSAALVALGIPVHVALVLGTASYFATALLGITIARRCAREASAPVLIAYLPAAFVLLGGAYVHIAQMAAALPLALVLWSRGGALARYAAFATACLAIPWQTLAVSPEIAALFPPRGYVDPAPLLARAAGGGRLAQDAWTAWIATTVDRDHRTLLEIVLGKVPTWGGLLMLVIVATARGLAAQGDPAPRHPRRVASLGSKGRPGSTG